MVFTRPASLSAEINTQKKIRKKSEKKSEKKPEKNQKKTEKKKSEKKIPIPLLTSYRTFLFGWIGRGLSVAYTAPQIMHTVEDEHLSRGALGMWV